MAHSGLVLAKIRGKNPGTGNCEEIDRGHSTIAESTKVRTLGGNRGQTKPGDRRNLGTDGTFPVSLGKKNGDVPSVGGWPMWFFL